MTPDLNTPRIPDGRIDLNGASYMHDAKGGLTPPRQAQLVPLVRDAHRDRERDAALRPAFA